MLSSSIAATNAEVDLEAIADRTRDPMIPGGTELLNYVDSVLTGTDIAAARAAVVAVLGNDAAVDAAGVMGNFEMMNRIADGVGMPVGTGTRKRMADIITNLELDRYPHA